MAGCGWRPTAVGGGQRPQPAAAADGGGRRSAAGCQRPTVGGRLLAADCINRPKEFMVARQLLARGLAVDPVALADETIDPKKLKIKLGDFIVAENGKISDQYNEEKLKEYMKWDSIMFEVNLKLGNDAFECYTCDFTHDYIDINADYRN